MHLILKCVDLNVDFVFRLGFFLQNKFIIKIRDFSMLKLVNIVEVKYMHEERMCGRESNVMCGIKK